jgi:hypothetical protein
MINSREVNIDFLKMVSIFGVVYIHGAETFVQKNIITSTLSDFFRFGVPIFIILWAYFLEKTMLKNDNSEHTNILIAKFKYFFVIYIIWSMLYFLLRVNWNTLTLSSFITKYFSGYGWAGQYFFIILFQLIISYKIIRYSYDLTWLRSLTMIIFSLITIIYSFFPENIPSVILKLGDRPFIFWIIYVYIGIELARNNIYKIPNWLIVTLLLIPIEHHFNKGASAYIRPSILLSSILTTIIIVQKKWEIHSSLIRSIIHTVGQNTMIIFISNPIIIILFNLFIPEKLLHQQYGIVNNILIPFFTSITIIATGLVIKLVLQKINFTKVPLY